MRIRTCSICLPGMVLTLAIFVASAHAQPVQFQRYSTAEGLSSHAVTAVLQDSRGFVWVGTYDGLNRYDGRRFVRYPVGGAYLTDDAVLPGALLEHAGGLWIGTVNGLNRLDLATNRVDRFLEASPADAAPVAGAITSMAATDTASLWVGTRSGLWRLDIATRTMEAYAVDADTIPGARLVMALHVDATGGLWTGTSSGLYRFDAGRNAFSRVETPEPLPVVPVTALQTMSDGALWMGILGGGVIRLEPGSRAWATVRRPREVVNAEHHRVYAMAEDHAGTIWITSFGDGVCAYGGAPDAWSCATHALDDPRSLSDNQTTSLHVDRSGNLFVGTWNGLSKLRSPKAFTVYPADHDAPGLHLSHPRVNAIHEARDGALWVGLYGEVGSAGSSGRHTLALRRTPGSRQPQQQ